MNSTVCAQRLERSQSLGHHTNNVSELWAVWLALSLIDDNASSFSISTSSLHNTASGVIDNVKDEREKEEPNKKGKRYIRILSDSKYTIGVLSKSWTARKNKHLVSWLRKCLSDVCASGYVVTFHWVGAHSGVPDNERADQLANNAAKSCRTSSAQNKHLAVTKPPRALTNF